MAAVGVGVGVALLIQLMLRIHGHLHQLLMGVGVGIGTLDPTRIKTLPMADLGVSQGSAGRASALIALLIGKRCGKPCGGGPYRYEGSRHHPKGGLARFGSRYQLPQLGHSMTLPRDRSGQTQSA